MRKCTIYTAALVLIATTTGVLAADWPQWRGADRMDLSSETGLLKTWPGNGPERVWLYEDAGAGYAGFSVVGDRLFTMGTRDEQETLLALDAASGEEIWATPMDDVLENNWGDGPRGTPTVDDGRLYAMAANGTLVCADTKSGRVHWKASMKDLGGKTPNWGYSESVLVDGDLVVCTPGGDEGAVAALNKQTGNVVWQSKALTDKAHYVSPIVFEWNGERQYAQLTMKTLAGLSAKDGTVLWKTEWPGRTAVIPTPIFRDGQVYITSGYRVGCKAVKLLPGHEVEAVYTNKVMVNHHGGVVLVDDHLYGYSDGKGWVCQDFETGELVWSSKDLGKGAVTYADGMLYCVDESDGTVALVEASPEGWNEAGRFTLDPQSEIRSKRGKVWTHPVVANGRLYLRDQDLIYCFRVS